MRVAPSTKRMIEMEKERQTILDRLKADGVATVNGRKVNDLTTLELFAVCLHLDFQKMKPLNN